VRFEGALDAFGVRVRAAGEDDADFMYYLRTLPSALGRIGDPPPDVEAQRRWIARITAHPDEWCFIIEEEGSGPVGTFSVTGLGGGVWEPGRWILAPGSLAAPGSSLLAYSYAFERLGAENLRMCVTADNLPVISYHRRLGERETRIERKARCIQGEWKDLVWFELPREEWPRVRDVLRQYAEAAERMRRQLRSAASDSLGSGG